MLLLPVKGKNMRGMVHELLPQEYISHSRNVCRPQKEFFFFFVFSSSSFLIAFDCIVKKNSLYFHIYASMYLSFFHMYIAEKKNSFGKGGKKRFPYIFISPLFLLLQKRKHNNLSNH